jgi:hypothetical protein
MPGSMTGPDAFVKYIFAEENRFRIVREAYSDGVWHGPGGAVPGFSRERPANGLPEEVKKPSPLRSACAAARRGQLRALPVSICPKWRSGGGGGG